MKRAIAVLFAGVATAALAQAPNLKPKPPAWQTALQQSKSKVGDKANTCAGCHGAKGIPAAGTPFPRLAGLPVEYVAKQLFDYRDGSRPNAVMAPLAKGLSDADIAALARHYAALPAPAIKAASGGAERARQLARYGDNQLAIPACADCHGSDATGGGPILPPLAQPAPYTAAQLEVFRSGERRNDGESAMRGLAKRLSEADIKALADYFGRR